MGRHEYLACMGEKHAGGCENEQVGALSMWASTKTMRSGAKSKQEGAKLTGVPRVQVVTLRWPKMQTRKVDGWALKASRQVR